MVDKDRDLLAQHLPQGTIEQVYEAVVKNGIQLRISRARATKLGDYRPPINGKPARISINHDLNKYEFFITFVHELAHHLTFQRFGRRHLPHGTEWKENYQQLMLPYFNRSIFPADVELALHEHLYVANVANGSETVLKRILRKYDPAPKNGGQLLESLPLGQVFMIPGGRIFQKLDRRRKRFMCRSIKDNRIYLFSPLAMVQPLDNGNTAGSTNQ